VCILLVITYVYHNARFKKHEIKKIRPYLTDNTLRFYYKDSRVTVV